MIKKISILLPTYNSSKYIRAAIQSILNQTFKNYELLIIDDGSTDDTEKIVQSFDDKRISYIKKKHTGLADTLNYGLKIAKYIWVARMDSDDIANPNRLMVQVRELERDEKNNTIIFSEVCYFKNNKLIYRYKTAGDTIKLKDFALHSPIPHSSVLYNKDFILSNKGYDSNLLIAEDYELWLRLFKKASFRKVKENLVFMRLRRDSMSRIKFQKTKKAIYKIQETYYKNLFDNLMISSNFEENNIKGWREFLFGTPKLARQYWIKNVHSFLKIKIIIAYFLSFLPTKYLDSLLKSTWRIRFSFLLNNVFNKNKVLTESFNYFKKMNL